jgi:hypothetical protein
MMRKIFILLAGVMLVLIGVVIGQATADPDPTIVVPAPTSVRPTTPGVVKGAPVVISEGVWEVGGEDVSPGTYRVSRPLEEGSMCYWQISTDGAGADIVKNGVETGGTPQVKLLKGQWFKTTGCGVWGRR